MYATLKRLYNDGNGPLDKAGLKNAIGNGWITEEEYKEITGDKYVVA